VVGVVSFAAGAGVATAWLATGRHTPGRGEAPPASGAWRVR